MNNPPFLPLSFAPGPPTTPQWESGPTAFVPYNGQKQQSQINTAAPSPPWEAGPDFADPGFSNVNVQGPQYPDFDGTPTLGAGTIVPVPGAGTPAQARMFLQGGNLYILDNNGSAYVVPASAVIPQPAIYSPTK